MERLWTHFEVLAAQCLEAPSRLVGDVCVLPKEEMDLLAATSRSQLETRTPPGENVVDAFESACARYADRVAVAMHGETISYAGLDRRADVVARALVEEYEIGTDDVVAVLFEPSIEAVVAILGVLKAGAAYLPLDPNWPERRTQYVLDNSQSRIVIAGAGLDAAGRRFGTLPVLVSAAAGTPRAARVRHLHIWLHGGTQGGSDRASVGRQSHRRAGHPDLRPPPTGVERRLPSIARLRRLGTADLCGVATGPHTSSCSGRGEQEPRGAGGVRARTRHRRP
jgi:hypothetical protein